MFRVESEKFATYWRQNAGPSTAFGANNAPNFAQDDKLIENDEILGFAQDDISLMKRIFDSGYGGPNGLRSYFMFTFFFSESCCDDPPTMKM